MSDLAKRLREVAHKADAETHNRAILTVTGKRMSRDEKRVVVSWARSTAVAAAVLRELAAFVAEVEQDRPDLGVIYRVDLAGLADSIEKGEVNG